MGSLIEEIVLSAREYIGSERESVLQAKALAHTAASSEIVRLRQQNTFLANMLESEKLKADKAKDELIQRVSVFLGEYTSDRDKSLREAVSQVQVENEKAEEGMQKFDTSHGELMDTMVSEGQEATVSLNKGSTDAKRTRDGALKVRFISFLMTLS